MTYLDEVHAVGMHGPRGGDIGKRSAGLIRAGGTMVTIAGPTEARPADGLAVDFVVVSDRAQLSEIVRRVRDGRLRNEHRHRLYPRRCRRRLQPDRADQREDDHSRSSVSDTHLSMHALGVTAIRKSRLDAAVKAEGARARDRWSGWIPIREIGVEEADGSAFLRGEAFPT